MEKKEILTMIETADHMRSRSYSPYSHFTVGAALMGDDGKIYTGCNIENAAFGPTICAERTAIFKAVSEGMRSFRAIAIMGATEQEPVRRLCFPCGVCRQVMSEFCDDSFPIYLGKMEMDGTYTYECFSLGELLPGAFRTEMIPM